MPDQDWTSLHFRERDCLVTRLWRNWAAHTGSLYTDLRDTIGRSIRGEKERLEKVEFGTVIMADCSSADNFWWPVNVLMGFTSSWYEREGIGTGENEGSADPDMGIGSCPTI